MWTRRINRETAATLTLDLGWARPSLVIGAFMGIVS
jgi:hypothetical protein